MASGKSGRVQEEKLQGLEGFIESYETATTTGAGEDEAAAIADFFVDEGIGVRQSSLCLWDHYWTRALAGKIPNQQVRGAKLLALLARGGRLLRRDTSLARAYTVFSSTEVVRLYPF